MALQNVQRIQIELDGSAPFEYVVAKAGEVFVPSRGFLFFYPISYSPYKSRAIFIICGANIFKPSECYF